jgi:WD40 repeat protein
MPVDSRNESPIIEHPSTDRLLGWLPGRSELLFISDRSGTRDLWAVPVNKGKQSGSLMRIYADIGEAEPMGFTPSGDCFLGFHRSNYTACIVPFNFEEGVVKEESGKSLSGSNTFVKWSPDGQYLAYTKENIKTNNPWQLTIQDISTGEEHKVANNLLTSRSPCWSPDGKSILVVGHDKTKATAKGYKGGISWLMLKQVRQLKF